MKTIITYILIALLLPLQGWSNTVLLQADQAYRNGNYTQAIKYYESYANQALQPGITYSHTALSDFYYNLGNCYYRTKETGKAVLNYQRAIRFNPQNQDAAFNLELVQAKLKDQFDQPSEMFYTSWTRSLITSNNATQWGFWALGWLILTIGLLALYFLSNRIKLRKTGLYGGVVTCIAMLLCHGFAYIQYQTFHHQQMIVVQNDINMYEAPSATSKKIGSLHEGTTLIVEETVQQGASAPAWYNVTLPNGSQTWIENKNVASVQSQPAQKLPKN